MSSKELSVRCCVHEQRFGHLFHKIRFADILTLIVNVPGRHIRQLCVIEI